MATQRQLFDAFVKSFRRVRSVRDPVASEVWTIRDANGRKRQVEIAIGRPEPIPGDKRPDWYCPVHIEGWRSHVTPVFGVGPLDTLQNASAFVKMFRDQVADMHIRRDWGAKWRKALRPARRSSTKESSET